MFCHEPILHKGIRFRSFLIVSFGVVVGGCLKESLFKELEKQRVLLCSMFVEPYRSEVVFLIAARQRYKAFLFMLLRFARDFSSRLVPTSDILLMWLTHQVCFTLYFNSV